ncbi:MAG: SDR family oxidoreductase [Levilactobacillus sp.]|uniref:SDR family oxidoreductase n=1 Tax=Levilactobacillus suantsaiihabitans TaxID=2487722 RepID=A0A4Z0J879_9LACO|nr:MULTISPECIES: SDR family oxidoreductase [Levilactobacillus]MCI1552837.1 SDR family oxidoreductase [Levilactobacillus sp.]MCI1597977.1 SDR family oxidoreductase [Levilactobacillus sp.]MCI1606711.1 SDR family oxidoreductase [Levilactobacillus sp.]TGD17519.1 SDR family oxidoreductase [Levilactobacillus suantsaiihabitans]
MRVMIVGANGEVGRLLVAQLLANGDEPIAGLRADEDGEDLEDQGIAVRRVDLLAKPERIASTLMDAEAVIFAAGSGGRTKDDMTLLIDLDGAVKTMQAAEIAGVKRFMMISMLFAEDRNRWADPLKPLYVAKFYADNWLVHQTHLAYTIVQPGALSFHAGTGKVQSDPLAVGSIPRADLAAFMVAALHAPQTIGKTIPLLSGEQPIQTVIDQL